MDINSPDAFDTFGATSASGVPVSPESALTWSAWWRGVTLLAKGCAKTPLHVYKRTDPEGDYGTEPDRQHPAYNLLRWQPSEYMTAFQFRLALTGHAVNRGNGYAYIWRSGPDPVELTILDPDSTEPFPGQDGRLWYKVVPEKGGEARRVPAADILHVKGFGFDGLRGYPLWQVAKETIALGLSGDRFKASRLKNQARPSVLLETEQKMNNEAKTRLRNDWERMHMGLENWHRTAILDNGLKANKMTFSAEEMQEVEQAGLTIRDAANFLGVPSSKLGDVAGVKYASKEQDDLELIGDGLDFWFCVYESECRDKLLSEAEKAGNTHIIQFDRTTLIRSDMAAQANYFRTALGGRSWMTPNEVRDRLHLEPSKEPDADALLTPLNMGQGGPDNQPANPADEPPGRPPEDGAPAEPAPDNTAARQAAAAALAHATRKMVARVGFHANRAAKDGAKFMAFLDTWRAGHSDVILAEFGPAGEACRVFHKWDTEPAGLVPAVWLVDKMEDEFKSVADTATPKTLAASVAALVADQAVRLPKEIVGIFLGDGS